MNEWRPFVCVFQVSVWKFWKTSRFTLQQFIYPLSTSERIIFLLNRIGKYQLCLNGKATLKWFCSTEAVVFRAGFRLQSSCTARTSKQPVNEVIQEITRYYIQGAFQALFNLSLPPRVSVKVTVYWKTSIAIVKAEEGQSCLGNTQLLSNCRSEKQNKT